MAFKIKENKNGTTMEIDELTPIKIGSVEDIEKLKEILTYLIENLKDTKYKTELIKLSFILDYLYCKEFGTEKGPTTVDYVKYNYGPYADSFIEAFNELVEEGIIIEINLAFGIGYELKEKKEVSLEADTQKILKEVIETFGQKSLKQLKTFIYDREEFKRTEFGEPILFQY